MKILKIAFLIFCFSSVKANAQGENGLATIEDLDPAVDLIRPYKGTLEVEKEAFLLGDINGDKVKDSAFVVYKRVLSPDSTYVKECGQNVCYCRIKFQSNISEMIVEGYSVFLKPVPDVNGDGKDEVLIFRELEQYMWHDLSLYSFYNGQWKLLSSVPVFLGDDPDYENRIIKSGSRYYIMEDVWDKHFTFISRKKVLIKKKY